MADEVARLAVAKHHEQDEGRERRAGVSERVGQAEGYGAGITLRRLDLDGCHLLGLAKIDRDPSLRLGRKLDEHVPAVVVLLGLRAAHLGLAAQQAETLLALAAGHEVGKRHGLELVSASAKVKKQQHDVSRPIRPSRFRTGSRRSPDGRRGTRMPTITCNRAVRTHFDRCHLSSRGRRATANATTQPDARPYAKVASTSGLILALQVAAGMHIHADHLGRHVGEVRMVREEQDLHRPGQLRQDLKAGAGAGVVEVYE